jgi:predicted 2-oxoglutarate/Fe(II)-dependent dioxygenase YbiX
MPEPDFFKRLGLLIVNDFASPEMCAALQREMHASVGSQGTVFVPGYGNRLDPDFRSVRRADISDSSRASLRRQFADLLPQVSGHFGLDLSGSHEPQSLVYRKGDFHQPHRDATTDEAVPAAYRLNKVAAVLFVNTEGEGLEPAFYQGGSLAFYGLLPDPPWNAVGMPITGVAGVLVAFPAELPHEVRVVARGERLVISTFYY